MKRRANEEIYSGSDSEYEDEKNTNAEEIEPYETDHQTKVRLTKEMHKRLKEEIKSRKVEDVEAEVSKTLEEEALEKQGKLMKNIAADCMKPDAPILSLSKFKHDVTCFAYSVNGHFIFSGSRTGDIIKWNLETGESLAVIKGGRRQSKHKFHCSRVTAIAACDEFLATGDLENKIFIWNISDMSLKKVLTKHRKSITSLVFRRHSQQLFSGDKKGTIFVWDMVLMETIEELQGHTGEITGLDSNLANNCVSSSGIGDLSVKLWKVDNGSVLTYGLPKGNFELSIECITLVNERYILAGSVSNKIYLWDSVNKKTAICVVSPAHEKPANADLIVSADVFVSAICALKQSTVFATASNQSQVKLWNLVAGANDQFAIRVLFVLPNIVGCVNELRFSPNNKNLAIGICDQHKTSRMQKRTPHTKSAVNIYKLFK